MIRRAMTFVLILGIVGAVQAGPFRTLFLTDDQIVDLGGMEIGLQIETGDSLRAGDLDMVSAVPYVRVGLFEKMSAYVRVPYSMVSSDISGIEDQSGLGDVAVGVHLLADDGSENNCSIMTTIEVAVPTGDKDKGLGSGDFGWLLGLALGIDLEQDTSVIFSGSYNVVPEGEDVLAYGVGVVYEVSPRLWITVEAEGTDQDFDGESPAVFSLGMSYKGFCDVKGLMLAMGGGTGLTDASPSGVGALKLAYEF